MQHAVAELMRHVSGTPAAWNGEIPILGAELTPNPHEKLYLAYSFRQLIKTIRTGKLTISFRFPTVHTQN